MYPNNVGSKKFGSKKYEDNRDKIVEPLTPNVEINYFVKVIRNFEILLFSYVNSNELLCSRVIEIILSEK